MGSYFMETFQESFHAPPNILLKCVSDIFASLLCSYANTLLSYAYTLFTPALYSPNTDVPILFLTDTSLLGTPVPDYSDYDCSSPLNLSPSFSSY